MHYIAILQEDKIIISGELYRWLKELEKDKPTMMDRKTLSRTLSELKQDGLCKVSQIAIPPVTNFSRTRIMEVIYHPSINTDNISSHLFNQIYERYREFEFQIRSRESVKSTEHPVTVVTGSKRSWDHVDEKSEIFVSMCKNGYVLAKMVRVKLLHKFLWDYISSSSDWQNTLPSTSDDRNLKNHCKTCQFTIDAAMKAMPLELFLQIVGCAKDIDGMVQKCRMGLRLMDLPLPDYKLLLDTHATARLSRIINVLLRLKVRILCLIVSILD